MGKGRQRQVKWYFQNEAEVMEELGLRPTPGSGSKWTHKEDGENDYILAQLKSTDKTSYRIDKLDIDKLEYNAGITRKLPLFILQFLNSDTRYAIVRIEDLPKVAEYIKYGKYEEQPDKYEIFNILTKDEGESIGGNGKQKEVKTIKSSADARKDFYRKREEYWEDKRWR